MKTKNPWRRVNRYLGTKSRKQAAPKLIANHIDEDYYLSQNPDIRADGMDAAYHYFHFGAREGRNPTEEFDTNNYQKHFGKFIPMGMNPFLHFLTQQVDLTSGDTKDKIVDGTLKYSVDDLVEMNAAFDLEFYISHNGFCLLYTSDAADE